MVGFGIEGFAGIPIQDWKETSCPPPPIDALIQVEEDAEKSGVVSQEEKVVRRGRRASPLRTRATWAGEGRSDEAPGSSGPLGEPTTLGLYDPSENQPSTSTDRSVRRIASKDDNPSFNSCVVKRMPSLSEQLEELEETGGVIVKSRLEHLTPVHHLLGHGRTARKRITIS